MYADDGRSLKGEETHRLEDTGSSVQPTLHSHHELEAKSANRGKKGTRLKKSRQYVTVYTHP